MAASATSLKYRRVFGINGSIADNISFTDQDSIVYVAGHNIVLYNKTDKKQRIINLGAGDQATASGVTDVITAFASCTGPQKYIYLTLFTFYVLNYVFFDRYAAIAEKGSEHAQAHIFDLKKFRRIKTITTGGGVIADMTSKVPYV